MNKYACAFLAFGLLAACNPGAETNNPAVATEESTAERAATAPNVGANSFTEDQARMHLSSKGYTNPSGLTQSADGAWRGQATKDGKSVPVSVDYQGNVTTMEGTTP
jgi:putative membrane protein